MRPTAFAFGFFVWLTFFLVLCVYASAQTSGPKSLIPQAVDETNLTLLKGNTHPLARPEFDRGPAAPSLPMEHMLLLLMRSPEQEAALQTLLNEQQDKSSPNYHKWLTPDDFGLQFGPSDQDIQTVTRWLESHGFQVAKVAKGRTVLEFSGNAAQVQEPFHTAIHKYFVSGEEHWANTNDPQIPSALTPVVAGVVSLHNFRKKPLVRRNGTFFRSQASGDVKPLVTGVGGQFFALGPTDFAIIYNVLGLWNATPAVDGTGQTIAIVGRSNINMKDVRDFRSLFGLPPNDPQIILNGPDPGLVPGDETEADLDVQWSGAVAKNATIKLVVSESAFSSATDGVDLSAIYIVDNNIAPVMSESFGECEANLGTAGNAFYNALWEQAAAQGITVILSSGDNGAAGCDNGSFETTAKKGIAVSGLASTPFNVAVGGTDFDDANNHSQYWNPTNDPVTQASAKSYIPEMTWNDSCAQHGLNGCASAPSTGSNLVAGSGGPSAQYTKPSWQTGPGVPADGKRDLPDIAVFASNGFTGSFYIICETDVVTPPSSSCNLNNLGFTFQGVGGTSASAPAFAGIMALVNQKTHARQGNPNFILYKLAAKAGNSCDASNLATVTNSSCIFYDTTKGNISVECAGGSPNCSSAVAGGIGVLVDPSNTSSPAWTTTVGYDRATGLGSVNAANLANNWSSVTFTPSATALSLSTNPATNPIRITHGQSVNVNITVSPTSPQPTGDVSLIATQGTDSFGFDSLTLSNGAASGTTNMLPGGTSYSVTAHYGGDGTYGSSDSNPVTVTVNPEASKTTLGIVTFDPSTGKVTSTNAKTFVYGSPYILRVDVTDSSATNCSDPNTLTFAYGCPTGTVTLTDNGNPLDTGTFTLNSLGFFEDQRIQLPGGSHNLVAGYNGNNSYTASTSATDAVTVTPSPTTTRIDTNDNPVIGTVGVPFRLNMTTRSNSSGVVPTGTYTVFDSGSAVNGTSTILSGQPGSSRSGAFVQGSVTFTFSRPGSHILTATYSGDSNYAGSTSVNSFTVNVNNPTTTTIASSSLDIIAGNTITLTAIVDTTVKSPTPSNNVVFNGTGDGNFPGTIIYTSITDASGNAALQASLTVAPLRTEQLSAFFNGDANYASSASAPLNITVVTPDFTFGASSSTLTVPAGQTGTLPLTLTPATNLTSSVNLSITSTGMPAGSASSFAPNPVTLSNSVPSTVIFSVTVPAPSSTSGVMARSVKQAALFPLPRGGWLAISLTTGLGMVALLLLPGRRRFRASLGLGLVCVCALILAIGCGGGGSGAVAGGGGGGGGPQLVGTTTTITAANSKVAFPAPAQFTITVSPASGSTPPTGTVNLTDNFQVFQTLPLTNGQAQVQIPALHVGAHTMVAKYSGDTRYQASTSAAFTQIITGSTGVQITAVTGVVAHQIFVTITVQ